MSSGDLLAEIETDKATMEFEAVDEGTVAKIMVAEGTEGVRVNTPIAVLLAEGEDASAIDEAEPDADGSSHVAPHEPSDQTDAAKGYGRNPHAGGDHGKSSEAEGSDAKPQRSDMDQTPSGAEGQADGRIFASPLARRMAKERGLELSSISGSGPHGRIVKADVEGAADQPKPAEAPAPAQPEPGPRPRLGTPVTTRSRRPRPSCRRRTPAPRPTPSSRCTPIASTRK